MLVVGPALLPAAWSTLRAQQPSKGTAMTQNERGGAVQRFHAHTSHRPCGGAAEPPSLPASLWPPWTHLSPQPPEWLPEKLSLEDKCGSWEGIRGSSKLTDTRHQSKLDFQGTWKGLDLGHAAQ